MPSEETEGLSENKTPRRTHQTESMPRADASPAGQLLEIWRQSLSHYFTKDDTRALFNVGVARGGHLWRCQAAPWSRIGLPQNILMRVRGVCGATSEG